MTRNLFDVIKVQFLNYDLLMKIFFEILNENPIAIK